ncbi:MAG: hypothetical protein QOJ65_768 [Fimbriimonadaceae bacterium]|jgi:hypothetical protein|nr:hypothetical protein [Fimbriimonadaceae bacterium]
MGLFLRALRRCFVLLRYALRGIECRILVPTGESSLTITGDDLREAVETAAMLEVGQVAYKDSGSGMWFKGT